MTIRLLLPTLLTVMWMVGCANSDRTGEKELGSGDDNCALHDCGTGCEEVGGFRVDQQAECYALTRTPLACRPVPDPTVTAPGTTGDGCFVSSETGDTYIYVNSYTEQELPGFTSCDPRNYGALPGCD